MKVKWKMVLLWSVGILDFILALVAAIIYGGNSFNKSDLDAANTCIRLAVLITGLLIAYPICCPKTWQGIAAMICGLIASGVYALVYLIVPINKLWLGGVAISTLVDFIAAVLLGVTIKLIYQLIKKVLSRINTVEFFENNGESENESAEKK